jgi:hypothetical protein
MIIPPTIKLCVRRVNTAFIGASRHICRPLAVVWQPHINSLIVGWFVKCQTKFLTHNLGPVSWNPPVIHLKHVSQPWLCNRRARLRSYLNSKTIVYGFQVFNVIFVVLVYSDINWVQIKKTWTRQSRASLICLIVKIVNTFSFTLLATLCRRGFFIVSSGGE